MSLVYGDLHIHIGRTSQGRPVKITASAQMTVEKIAQTALKEKGLHLIGLVDAACSGVLQDLQMLITAGKLLPLPEGGYRWRELAVFFGSEVEIAHAPTGRGAHFLAFFPCYKTLKGYAAAIAPHLTNPSLSTQRLRLTGDDWLKIVVQNGGVPLAAHAFTPHKGVYGSCVRRLEEMFAHPQLIKGLELGLSANTELALGIADTHRYPFLANSDAHSLQNIAREFTVYDLAAANFKEWRKALENGGAGIAAVHGLEPLLGKYYRSFCPKCQFLANEKTPVFTCPRCGQRMIPGVWDRIKAISQPGEAPARPPYIAHAPLQMLPGIGPKTYRLLIQRLGTEIDILYSLPLAEIAELAGQAAAQQIGAVRAGTLSILPGGGGKYGRVEKSVKG